MNKAVHKNVRKEVSSTPKRSVVNKKLINWFTPVLFIFFATFMLLGQNRDLLYKLQDLDLFVFNKQFLLDDLQRIGGLSMYAGSFLTQFFYNPVLGALLFTTMLLLVGIFTAKVFKLSGWSYPLAYIPSMALLLCLTQLGYLLYFIKLDGYIFNNIVGVILLLAGFLAFSKLDRTAFKMLHAIGFVLLGYPICGVYALAGGFLMCLDLLKSFLNTKHRRFLLLALLQTLVLVLTPILFYQFVFEQIAFGDIYIANLPYLTLNKGEWVMWLPFLSMAVLFISLLWLKPDTSSKRPWLKFTPFIIFVAFMGLVYAASFKDANFHAEIGMMNAVDKEDWKDVLQIARTQKEEPTRLIVLSTNLALYKLGMAADESYQFKNGDKPMKSFRPISPIHIAGPCLFYQYGISNYSTKWCMEGIVEYGFSVSVLKYFVLSSLINKDIALAKKYNDVLLATWHYKKWALNHQIYIDHPESIEQSAEFREVLLLTHFEDDLNEDYYNMEAFFRNHFARMTTVSSELTELSVLFNLEKKDDKRFWPRLFRWVKLNPTKKIPVHFQEAALLFANLTNMDISGAPFDPNVVSDFKNFLSMVQAYRNYPESSMKEYFKEPFGKTYWYYYFFMKNPQADSNENKDYK